MSSCRFVVRADAAPGALARVLDTVRLFDELPVRLMSTLDRPAHALTVEVELEAPSELIVDALTRRLQRNPLVQDVLVEVVRDEEVEPSLAA